MQTDSKYVACIIVFINPIIRYFINLKDKAKTLQFDVPSAFLDELDSSFAPKLDVDSNAVAIKFQMHLSIYNAIYYKYGAAITG